MTALILIPQVNLVGRFTLILDRYLDAGLNVILAVVPSEEDDPEACSMTVLKHQVAVRTAKKILICGLSGSGKTTLAKALAPKIDAVHLNNDVIRSGPHRGYGFSIKDRLDHAIKVGQWSDMITKQGHHVIIDMICPTEEMRRAIWPDFTIHMDTIEKSRFADTDRLFEAPKADFICNLKEARMYTEELAKVLKPRVKVVSFPNITVVENYISN